MSVETDHLLRTRHDHVQVVGHHEHAAVASVAHIGPDGSAWVRAIDCYPVADYFVSRLVMKTSHAAAKAGVWSGRRAELTRRCGFHLARRLAEQGEADEAFFLPLLARIERETHGSPNRARESMNTALIAIGKRGGRLRREARRIAKALGPVEIDHGETSCKTPDARTEIP